jgi:cell division control protein 11
VALRARSVGGLWERFSKQKYQMAHRKKVPLQFNLMLAGHSRTGRTDFISTLVETLEISHLHQNKGSETQILFPTDVFKPTESTCIIECEDPFQYQKILLKSAYEGLELRADEYADMLLVYIEGQYDEILKEQTKIRRNVKKIDHEVHACLYFLNPDTILSSKGLTIMDKIVLEKLCERVNVIPCLAKSVLIY